MQWRDLAGRLYGLAYWVNHIHDPAGRVDDSDPVVQEFGRLYGDVFREGQSSDSTEPPTDRGAPPRRSEEGG